MPTRKKRVVVYRNGSRGAQIQSISDTLGNFREDISTQIGALVQGQSDLKKSFDEFKGKMEKKVDDHESKISKAEGGLTAWKWIAGTGGVGLLLDGLAHLKALFKP